MSCLEKPRSPALWVGAGMLALLLLPGGVAALCAGAVLGYRGRGWLESLGKEARE